MLACFANYFVLCAWSYGLIVFQPAMSSGMASMTMSGCQKPKQYSMALPPLQPRSCCNQQWREQGHWAIGTKQRWNRSGKLHIQYVIADTPLPTSPRSDGPSHKAEQGEMVGATKPVDNGQWPMVIKHVSELVQMKTCFHTRNNGWDVVEKDVLKLTS